MEGRAASAKGFFPGTGVTQRSFARASSRRAPLRTTMRIQSRCGGGSSDSAARSISRISSRRNVRHNLPTRKRASPGAPGLNSPLINIPWAVCSSSMGRRESHLSTSMLISFFQIFRAELLIQIVRVARFLNVIGLVRCAVTTRGGVRVSACARADADPRITYLPVTRHNFAVAGRFDASIAADIPEWVEWPHLQQRLNLLRISDEELDDIRLSLAQ